MNKTFRLTEANHRKDWVLKYEKEYIPEDNEIKKIMSIYYFIEN